MQIKLFSIPINDEGRFSEEMNRFLRANKILEVITHLSNTENSSIWCFCIKYIGGKTK